MTLDGAIADADVPRGSAYRLWQDDNFTPQQSYRRAVQVAVLERAGQGVESMTAKFKETRDEYSVYLESDDPEDRDWAFRTILRIVANHSFERLDGSRCWRLYQALRGCVVAKTAPGVAALDAVRRGEEAQIEAYAAMYDEIAKVYGARIREPYTMKEFATCAFALNQGIASKVTEGFRRRDITRPTGRNGEDEDWTLFAVGLEALVDQFFEPAEAA